MPKIDPATLIVTDPEVVDCELGDGSALLNLRSNIYYNLNEVGAFVWKEAAHPIAFRSLVNRVCETYDAPCDRVGEELSRLVGQMDEAGLVQCSRP